MQIQHFIPIRPAEPLGTGILIWFARLDILNQYSSLFCPATKIAAHKLRAIVNPQDIRQPCFFT